MTMKLNRQWRLASRPKGRVRTADFTWATEPVSMPAEGEILVRILYLSADPTQRGWLERDTYLPAVAIGEVVRSFAVGRVVVSNAPGFEVGELVQGLFGWQDYAVVRAGVGATKVPDGVPIELAMGALGLTGLTAYVGLLDIGRPKPGETVVVSGAAGATGSVVGQIAKIKGCRAVGIAGGAAKCTWLVRESGFDAAIDYRAEDVQKRLGELCPKGIDVYFDNVGGSILDAALARLAFKGRVVLCGAISSYNDSDAPTGPKNYLNLLLKRGRMEGFIVMDHLARIPAAMADLAAWYAEGKVKNQVDVQMGLENAPPTLNRLFDGTNRGKQLLKIAD